MNFNEMLEQLRNPVEGTELPPTIYDDLHAAYQNDLSVRDAAVTERETRLAAAEQMITERDAEVVRFKSANYDLLMSMPGKTGEAINPPAEEKPTGVSSLFETT